jgi:hypothetical protein
MSAQEIRLLLPLKDLRGVNFAVKAKKNGQLKDQHRGKT